MLPARTFSEHCLKVQQNTAQVCAKRNAGKVPAEAAVSVSKIATYFVHPEYKLPHEPKDAADAAVAASGSVDAAVAESSGSGVAAVAASGSVDAAVAVHLWEWDGDETIHPF